MEQANNITHAYLHLMRKENVRISDLDSETQSYIQDLNKVTQLLINKARGGELNITPITERKIKNYDRAICEGIYDYLDERKDVEDSNTDSDNEDEQLRAIHEKQKGSLQDIDLEPSSTTSVETKEQNEESDNNYKGFWDWS